jgi:hypothetical protein
MHYEYTLPTPEKVFPEELRAGQTTLQCDLVGEGNGATGDKLPEPIRGYLGTGDVITCRVPIPPGVASVGWFTQLNNDTLTRSANGGVPGPGHATLWPVGYNNQVPGATPLDQLPAVTRMEHAYFTIRILEPGTLFLAQAVWWNIAKNGGAALYQAWTAAGRPVTPMPAPETHEELTLRLIERAGLIQPLMLLARESDQAKFVQQAIHSGVWEGFLRLVPRAPQ